MAFAAKQFGSRIANPQTVLNHIGSVPVDLSDESLTNDTPSPAADMEKPPVGLKIFQPEETTLEKEQARQLGQHLIRWRTELEAAQANFDEQKLNAYRQQEVDQQEIARRHKTLQQRERQVRSLEAQLLQLQNDVIDGHTAQQSIAEQLSRDGFLHVVDEEKIGALEDLRFEISERFEYLIERWQHFRDSS
jgi:predicted RNase H-like nuclease (RuvC/YqgF family)